MRNRAERAGFLILGTITTVLFTATVAHAQQKDCSDFNTQQDAQAYFDSHGGSPTNGLGLDVDGDGKACEGLPTGGASASPSPSSSATPIPTIAPSQSLTKTGAGEEAMALSGLSLLETGFGLSLLSRRLGVRRRALPVFLMRKLVRAAREGRNEIELGDDVYLVRRSTPLPQLDWTPPPLFGSTEVTAGRVYASLAQTNGHSLTNGHSTPVEAPAVVATIERGEELVVESPVPETEPTAVLRVREEWPFFTPPTS